MRVVSQHAVNVRHPIGNDGNEILLTNIY